MSSSVSSADKYLIQDAVGSFLDELHSSVPLMDLSDFFDETIFKDVLRLQRRKAVEDFMQQHSSLSGEKMSIILKELQAELDNITQAYLEKNEYHRALSVGFLEKWEEFLCERYRTWSVMELSRNPYIEIQWLEVFLHQAKVDVLTRYENYWNWKPGNIEFHAKRKTALEQRLDNLKEEVVDKQKKYLEGPAEEEIKLFEEMVKSLLVKLDQLKCFLGRLRLQCIPKYLLEGQVKEIEKFVDQIGIFKKKEYRRIHWQMLESLSMAMRRLSKAEDKILSGSLIQIVHELDIQLRNAVTLDLGTNNENEMGKPASQGQSQCSQANGNELDAMECNIVLEGMQGRQGKIRIAPKKDKADKPKRKRTRFSPTLAPPQSFTQEPGVVQVHLDSPIATSTPKELEESNGQNLGMSRKRLFQGMEFILTAALPELNPRVDGPQSIIHQYDMNVLRKEIESCGGKVIKEIGQESKMGKVFLISDAYCRSPEYLYSLAKGIPCVCNTWVQRCLTLNEVVNWSAFALPAGWSLERQEIIPKHLRKPLKDYRIQFLTSDKFDDFLHVWKLFLQACQAKLPSSSRKKGKLIPIGTQVVVVGYHTKATEQLLTEAESRNIPVVNPEWLVQAIITGEIPEMYDHEGYRVVMVGEEGSEQIPETTTDSVIISVAVKQKKEESSSKTKKCGSKA